MILAFIFAVYGLAALLDLLENVTAAFAPVFSSGAAVLAAGFCSAVYTYRRLEAKKAAKKDV